MRGVRFKKMSMHLPPHVGAALPFYEPSRRRDADAGSSGELSLHSLLDLPNDIRR